MEMRDAHMHMVTSRFDRRDTKKILLYVDLAVILVFAVSLVLLVKDAYAAGFYEASAAGERLGQSLWFMARETAFLVASLAWIFFRFFKDKLVEIQNPWNA
ncbi:MAG TPA: hypothetical protein VM889_07275 [Candidatus Thermoplasmatota archaeon]|nr:hypothetical protein [Candidatus Thermoplasmatota archaeon]